MSHGLPVDFGMWTTRNGQKALLSWWPDSGALTLDGPGGNQLLAVLADEDEIRRRLEGWEHECDRRDCLSWLASRLDGVR